MNKEGMAKNFDVVKQEFSDYKLAIDITMSKVNRTDDIRRKLHHLFGLIPDIHRNMPRTLSYGGVLLLTFAIICWWVL
jgi:hypothetical protein